VAVVSHACVLPVNQYVYASLLKLGWDLTLVVPERWRHEYSESKFAARPLPSLERRFVTLPVFLAGRPQRHFYVRPLARVVRELAPEVVLVEEETFSVAAAQWAAVVGRIGVPFGVQADENLDRPLPSIARRLRRYTLSRVSFVAARSPAAAALASRWGARGPVDLIPHAVPGWAVPAKSPERPFTVGYAGRLVPEKGVRDLIVAVGLLDPPVKALLVGDGVLRDELKATKIPNGEVEIRIGIAHDAMPISYGEMDVLVLPSRTTELWAEQFGRVLVEALWCGVPVVGSDSGEIPWVIETTQGGCIYPEGDVRRLAAILGELRDDPNRAAELSSAGRAGVERKFSVEAVAGELDRTLLSVVHGHLARAGRRYANSA
jgi:glycosyltransferase involved in cell wall biosynthesis